jgi:hypothetical protein
LAFVSSILVFAGPASAAEEFATDRGYEHGHEQFSVYLTGEEVRDGGDRRGSGIARLDFDPGDERVCYVLSWHDLEGDVTAFHLHEGRRHSDGGHVIDFFNDRHFNGERNTVASCVHADRRTIHDVLDDPSEFYLMVHTTAHERGAIRNQLG